MHELERLFAAADGEARWEDGLRDLFEAGDLDKAHDLLAQALAGLDTDLARECLAITPEHVSLSGWSELVEAIALHEGDPITGVTLAIANDADSTFEKGQMHRPYMMLGLYSDEGFAFSAADVPGLIAETRREDGPAWAGHDEDIEVYLDCEGLDLLNTRLLFHKQRHFFRDDAPDSAPRRYVEYVVACWWRALLFQQAVASECAIHGLPGGIPVIAGMVDLRPDVVCVHGIGARNPAADRESEEATELAEIIPANFIARRTVEDVKEFTGADLRRRVAETGQEDEPVKRGFVARLFGR